jgi:hypothetical protein
MGEILVLDLASGFNATKFRDVAFFHRQTRALIAVNVSVMPVLASDQGSASKNGKSPMLDYTVKCQCGDVLCGKMSKQSIFKICKIFGVCLVVVKKIESKGRVDYRAIANRADPDTSQAGVPNDASAILRRLS